MAEEKKTPESQNPETEKGGKKEGGEKTPKTFTQDQVNEIVSQKVNDLNEKFDKKLDDALKSERQKAEERAKLSAEELKEKELQEEREKLAQEKKNVTLRENAIAAKEKLVEKGLNPKFAKFVVSQDVKEQDTLVNEIESLINESVSAKVEAELKGKNHKDFEGNSDKKTKPEIRRSF